MSSKYTPLAFKEKENQTSDMIDAISQMFENIATT